MLMLVINVLYRAAIEGDQPVVNVCGSRMHRLFPQARQSSALLTTGVTKIACPLRMRLAGRVDTGVWS